MTENPPSPFFADLIARGYLENDVVKDAHEKSGFRLTAKAIIEMENLEVAKALDTVLRDATRGGNQDVGLIEMPLRFAFGR